MSDTPINKFQHFHGSKQYYFLCLKWTDVIKIYKYFGFPTKLISSQLNIFLTTIYFICFFSYIFIDLNIKKFPTCFFRETFIMHQTQQPSPHAFQVHTQFHEPWKPKLCGKFLPASSLVITHLLRHQCICNDQRWRKFPKWRWVCFVKTLFSRKVLACRKS